MPHFVAIEILLFVLGLAFCSQNQRAEAKVFDLPEGLFGESLQEYTDFLASPNITPNLSSQVASNDGWQPLIAKPGGYNNNWFWFRTTIRNPGPVDRSIVILLKNPFVWHFESYVMREDSGHLERVHRRHGVGEPRVEVTVHAHETVTYLVQTTFPYQTNAQFRVYDEETILSQDLMEHFYVFVSLGILCGLLIYNLLMYIALRDVSHLHYFLCALACFCVISLQSGYAQILISGPWLWLNNAVNVLALIGLIFFTQTFLSTKETAQRLHFAMSNLVYLAILHIVLVSLAPSALLLYGFELLVALAVIFCFAAGVRACRRKFAPAKYFLSGLVGLLLTGWYWFAVNFGWISDGFPTFYALNLGLILLMNFISLALATRVGILRQDLISALKNQNEELERRVAAEAGIIKRQQSSLVHSAKMSALGQMASGVAHEINNPLTIIRGRVSLIRHALDGGKPPGDRVLQDLNIIDTTSIRIAKITHSLLAFARGEKDDPFINCDLKEIAENVLRFQTEKFRLAEIKLELVSEGNTDVYCRSQQITHVILGLVNNAYDAVRSLDQRWVRVMVVGSEREVRLSVIDSGTGIAPDIVDRMMEPFFTTKEIGEGVGLGLSVSKGVIEEQGGRLFVDRTAQNTCISFTLPKRLQ